MFGDHFYECGRRCTTVSFDWWVMITLVGYNWIDGSLISIRLLTMLRVRLVG